MHARPRLVAAISMSSARGRVAFPPGHVAADESAVVTVLGQLQRALYGTIVEQRLVAIQ